MIQLFLDSIPAVIAEGTDITLKFENPLFAGEDSFSLDISLSTAQNLAIFGNLPANGYKPRKMQFDAEIKGCGRSLTGSAQISEISEGTIKLQFLEGRKALNISDIFEETYIDEMELFQASPEMDTLTPAQAYTWSDDRKYYCLPWVNNDSGNMQNAVTGRHPNASWNSENNPYGLSYQCRLMDVVEWVMREIGWSIDMSQLTDSDKSLIVCNALPAAWQIPELAKALPHWSVSEFIDNICQFLGGRFTFDFVDFKATFRYLKAPQSVGTVELSVVEDKVEMELSDDANESGYIGVKDIGFASGGSHLDGYYSCGWLLKRKSAVEFETFDHLYDVAKAYLVSNGAPNKAANPEYDPLRTTLRNSILHDAEYNQHYIFRAYKKELVEKHSGRPNVYDHYYMLMAINAFSNFAESERETVELQCVPIPIDYADDSYGMTMFLSPGSTDGEFTEGNYGGTRPADQGTWAEDRINQYNDEMWQPYPVQWIEQGEGNKQEVYNKLYLAEYNPEKCIADCERRKVLTPLPVPRTLRYHVFPGATQPAEGTEAFVVKQRYSIAPAIEPKVKYKFRFVTAKIPDIGSRFIINGHSFVCSSMDAQISPQSAYAVIKAEMYRIDE